MLGGEDDKRLLNVRLFDETTKRRAYTQQTEAAEKAGVSNCPHCAIGSNSNKARLYELAEMEADHVTAWSNGGASDIDNCEMLCKPRNGAKGNR